MADRVKCGILLRLFRLWRMYAYLDLMWMTRDLKNFLVNVFSDIVINIARMTSVFLLAERFDGIGMWTKTQVIFMLGYAMAVSGIMEMFFSYNILHISRRLGRGQMDHILIQPQPVWMGLLTEGFLPFSGSLSPVGGLGVMAWATGRLALVVSSGWLGTVALNLLASCVVVLAFSFLWGSLAFWAPRGAEEISSAAVRLLFQLKPFPLDGVGPALLGGLMTVLPIGFVTWYPCRHLLGIGSTGAAVTPLAAMVLAMLALLVFRKGMAHYGQTGSQRYLGFGHRS